MSKQDSAPMRSSIHIDVELDEQRVPQNISWSSSDGEQSEGSACSAFLLSIWEPETKQTLRIDLWTKDMQKDEMDLLFFQSFLTLSETYVKSNGEGELGAMIREFGYAFGEKAGLIRRAPAAEQGDSSKA